MVLGGGHSITALGHDKIIPKFEGRYPTIACNNAFILADWAEVLFGADSRWWQTNAWALHKHVGWYKVTRRAPPGRMPFPIRCVNADHKGGLSLDPTVIRGRNSGHMALNVATLMGAKKVVLIGFDLHTRGPTHFHALHQKPANIEAFKTWLGDFDLAKPILEKAGIEVLNANKQSALKAFPFCELEEFV